MQKDKSKQEKKCKKLKLKKKNDQNFIIDTCMFSLFTI